MLGDQIAEETGKVTGFRVVDAAGPKAEVSIQTKGNILGTAYQGRATYTSQVTAVQNRQKSSDPCCKRGLWVP